MALEATKAPAAQDALKTLLAARIAYTNADGSTVPVSLGWPAPAPRDEHVWIAGAITDWTQEAETTGDVSAPSAREELFTLTVNVTVRLTTGDYKTARDRAIFLANEVEYTARTNATLSGTVNYAEVVGMQMSEGIQDQKREVLITLNIRCQAQLHSA